MYNQTDRFRYRLTKGVKRGLRLKGDIDEVKIIKKFAKFFGITFSKQGKFKTTNYTFDFLQPDKELQESFNMYNEVLLLFSPYRMFDTRTLDFVDKTLLEFDNRLDKVCIFIVSQDKEIQAVIGQINKENKDSRILVPFTYDEALNLDKTSLHLRLRKYFYNRDLFAFESPLKSDAYFFGRSEIVQRLYDKYSLGEQSGLFGLRKTGKTSVLFALERLIKLKGGYSCYIDCQNPSIYKLDWNELLKYILQETIDKYQFPLDIESYDFSSKYAAHTFRIILEKLYKLNSNHRILYIFDEIENISFNISPEHLWRNGDAFISFWQSIRAVYQANPHLFSFIITGVNPLCIETININGYDNPIYGMIQPEYLSLFKVDDVKDMIENIGRYMGLIFDEEIYTKLTDEYGGHPFLIRHVCSLINKNVPLERPYNITKYEYNTRKEEYNKQIIPYIQLILQILERWYPEEYRLLEALACKNMTSNLEGDFYTIKQLEHLVGYGIVKQVNKKYFITIDAVTNYLIENKKDKEKPDTANAIWSKISIERNNLEIKLRKMIITVLSASYGKKQLKTKIIDVMEAERKERVKDKDLQSICENELYLLDCKKIISKNWTIFEKIFIDKSKFEMFLDTINSYRVDAHAKNITDDDYAVLMIAFKWFDNTLENIY